MRRKPGKMLLCWAVVQLLLAGCGGGGGGGDPVEPAGVALTIGADAACLETRAASGSRQLIGAPLDAGAQVVIYDFATRRQLASGQTGSDGFCRLSVTPGLTVAVVITGQNAGKTYRLSTIIAVVPIGGGEFVADPATSLAAEAIARKHFGKTALDQDTFDSVLDVARGCVNARTGADWSLAGNLICGTEFGAPESLNAGELQEVIDSVPDTINSKIVAAKNCVQQIRDAGVPITSMLAQERPDIESIFTGSVAARYEDLIERLHAFILPALFGGMEYQDSEGNPIWPTAFDLEIGKAYRAQLQDDGAGNTWLALSDDPASDAPGQITIICPTGDGTYRLVAVNSGLAWTFTQTFSGDSTQVYSVSLPDIRSDPGENPSVQIVLSLKDSQFTTPITFQGTLSAVGADQSSYTRITFDGSLATPEVSAQGRLQADFASSVPAGADADEYDVYDFPTGFSMTNGQITAETGGQTISLSGSVSLLIEPLADSGRPKLVPKHVEMTGAYSNGHSGLNFDGSITGDWTNPAETDPAKRNGSVHLHGEMTRTGYPGYYADIVFSTEAGTSTMAIALRAGNGSLTGTATEDMASDAASLTLVNQSGVQIMVSSDATGRISGNMTVSGERVADIAQVGNALRITYRTTPTTFDEFPIFD